MYLRQCCLLCREGPGVLNHCITESTCFLREGRFAGLEGLFSIGNGNAKITQPCMKQKPENSNSQQKTEKPQKCTLYAGRVGCLTARVGALGRKCVCWLVLPPTYPRLGPHLAGTVLKTNDQMTHGSASSCKPECGPRLRPDLGCVSTWGWALSQPMTVKITRPQGSHNYVLIFGAEGNHQMEGARS